MEEATRLETEGDSVNLYEEDSRRFYPLFLLPLELTVPVWRFQTPTTRPQSFLLALEGFWIERVVDDVGAAVDNC